MTRTNAGTTTTFTYQGTGEVLAKAQGSATTTYAYTAGGAPLGEKTGSTTLFMLRDVHGDVVGRVTSTAAHTSTVAYDPWGGVLSTTGTGQGLLGYQGDLTDQVTRQVDMGTRWYSPGLGRFSSRDVVFGDLGSPMSLNQHAYGAMNPITMIDPTGMLTVAGNEATQEDAEQYNRSLCERAGGTGCDAWTSSPYTSDTGPSVDRDDPAPPINTRAIAAMRGYSDVFGGCSRRCGAYADTTWSQGLAQTQDDDPGCGFLGWRCFDDAAGAGANALDRGIGWAVDKTYFWGAAQLATHVGRADARACGSGTCYDNANFFVPPGNDAITFGTRIFCRDVCDDRLVAHENIHVAQWGQQGVSFAARYVGQALFLARGSDCDNTWEREAYLGAGQECSYG